MKEGLSLKRSEYYEMDRRLIEPRMTQLKVEKEEVDDQRRHIQSELKELKSRIEELDNDLDEGNFFERVKNLRGLGQLKRECSDLERRLSDADDRSATIDFKLHNLWQLSLGHTVKRDRWGI